MGISAPEVVMYKPSYRDGETCWMIRWLMPDGLYQHWSKKRGMWIDRQLALKSTKPSRFKSMEAAYGELAVINSIQASAT